MTDAARAPSSRRLALRFRQLVWAGALLWTLLAGISLALNLHQHTQETLEVARAEARTAYFKDVLYRRWNTNHGGVYVPITDEMQPNPFLAGVENRDLVTTEGLRLTLVNPSYMTRQVHALERQEPGAWGHITSLDPLRPENAPDPWEAEALRAFERGATEVSQVQRLDGQDQMRLMRPLVTEEGCLKCHGAQGYQVGDIRGGISITIPMAPLQAASANPRRAAWLGHGLLWLLGLGIIGTGSWRIERTVAELGRYATNLEQSNRDLQQFAFVAAHDLQEPLRKVRAFGSRLQDGYAGRLDEQGQGYLQRMDAAAGRMQSQLNDLLVFARIMDSPPSPVPVDLGAVAHEVLQQLQGVIQETGAQVRLGDLPTVEADPAHMHQLIYNLVDNALKFRSQEAPPQVHLYGHCGNRAWNSLGGEDVCQFFVEDNGLGFDEKYLDRIFLPFQKLHTREAYEGSGMGLAICRKIVERHGGQILANSRPGQGAQFIVVLPARQT